MDWLGTKTLENTTQLCSSEVSSNIRKHTENELQSIKMHWMCPKQRNPFEDNDRTPWNHRAPEDYVKTPAPWEDRLACPPDMIATKTLENTTRLCSLAVEIDNRESPRQHRKKRLLPLHPNRLPGRTDSDTFFASIQSIQGYKCVLLFYSLLMQHT